MHILKYFSLFCIFSELIFRKKRYYDTGEKILLIFLGLVNRLEFVAGIYS